jgi:hypothetical protein
MRIEKLLLVLAIGIILLGGCAVPTAPLPSAEAPAPSATPPSIAPSPIVTEEKEAIPTQEEPLTPLASPAMEEMEQIVKVEAEGVILHYQAESLWGKDEFSTILQNRDSFSSNLVEKFNDDISKHGERGEYVANAYVEFNEEAKSTVLRCDIEGAVSKSESKYSATFFWLLRPLGLDFIDNDFEESEKGLFWEGLVNDVPTSVSVELPDIDGSIYEAWQHPVGHCHAHVWWEIAL